MSTIAASTNINTGYIVTSDATGTLVFQTGATPTTAMTIDASQNLLFNSGYGSVATAYGCRAWANFNGTTTVSVAGSGNISSITRQSAGQYTVNFTTALPDANYSVVTACNGGTNTGLNAKILYASALATTNFLLTCSDNNTDAALDAGLSGIAIFR